MRKLQNCPDHYYLNCKNAIIKCNICAAGLCSKSSAKLHYSPIDPTLSPHPSLSNPRDHSKSKSSRLGLSSERKLSHRLNTHSPSLSKPTKASGRVHHDGDLILHDSIRLEHKLRSPSTKSYSVSSAEYLKGKQQGIDVWAISIPNSETLYFLSEDLFLTLLSYLPSSP